MRRPEQPGPRHPTDDEWGPEDMMEVVTGMDEEVEPAEALRWETDEAREIQTRGAVEAQRGEREAREVGDGLSYRPTRRSRRPSRMTRRRGRQRAPAP